MITPRLSSPMIVQRRVWEEVGTAVASIGSTYHIKRDRMFVYNTRWYATSSTGHRSCRRQRNPPLSTHQGTGQTRRAFRREVPNYRFRSEQLHQLGNLLDIRADPVQEPVAIAALERGMAVRQPAEEPVHHSRAGPDELVL